MNNKPKAKLDTSKKKAGNNGSMAYILKPFVYFMHRTSLLAFIITVVGGLIFSVYILNGLFQQIDNDKTTKTAPTSNNTASDQITLSKLQTLKKSNENASYKTPSTGRINPFTE